MKDKLTWLTLNDEGNDIEVILKSEETTDVCAALKKARAIAIELGSPCSLSSLPKEALEKAGLEVMNIPHIYLANEIVVKSVSEAAGCSIACCRHCDSYEEGSCFHYGGHCDASSSECDRVHGSTVFHLIYDDETIGMVHIENEELTAKEVFDLLYADLQGAIINLIEDGLDFSDSSLFKLVETT